MSFLFSFFFVLFFINLCVELFHPCGQHSRSPVLPALCCSVGSGLFPILERIVSVRLPSISRDCQGHVNPCPCCVSVDCSRSCPFGHSGIRFGSYGPSIKSVSPTSVRSVNFPSHLSSFATWPLLFLALISFLPREFRRPCPYGPCIHRRHVEALTESTQLRRFPYVTSRLRRKLSYVSTGPD